MSQEVDKLKALLDEHYTWPDYYQFKFILKDKGHVDFFNDLFGVQNIRSKESKTGKYLSLTCRKLMNSSDEVLEVYAKVSKLKGVITL